MSRKSPAVAGLVLLILISVSSWLAPEHSVPEEHSSAAPGQAGRLGLARLLDAAGFPVERWDRRPGALPRRPGLVWLERLPEGFEASAREELPGEEPLRAALERGLANPLHYRRFAAQGGCVLIELSSPRQLERLRGEFGLFELEHLGWEPAAIPASDHPAPVPMVWTSGESLAIAAPGRSWIAGRESLPNSLVLLEDPEGRPAVLEVPLGRGTLVLVACGEAFDNARLAEHDHAVLAVRLAERAPRGGTIFLDESRGLGGDTPTLLELAMAPRALPFTVSLLALASLALWRCFAAREIPRDAPPVEFLSARTRALARARLLQRARRFDLLADLLRDGVTRRVGAQLRIPHPATLQARASVENAVAWARLAGADGDEARWAELLSREVSSPLDLARLDSDLRELEERLARQVAPPLGRHAALRARLLSAHDPHSPSLPAHP